MIFLLILNGDQNVIILNKNLLYRAIGGVEIPLSFPRNNNHRHARLNAECIYSNGLCQSPGGREDIT